MRSAFLIFVFLLCSTFARGQCSTTPAGAIALSKTDINFGQVDLGLTDTKTLKIGNTDPAKSLQIDEITSLDPQFRVLESTPICIKPGKQTSISVEFAPATDGKVESKLIIKHSDPGVGPVEVTLDGKGVGHSKLVATPVILDFGSVAVRKTATATFVITNRATTAETVERMKTSDHAFRIISPAFPRLIRGRENVTVTVEFRPKDLVAYEASIGMDSNLEKLPDFVSLRGQGSAGVPDIELSTRQIDFGKIDVGTFKEKSLTISNKGDGILSVDSFVFSDRGVKVKPKPPFDLKPGKEKTLLVRFRPSGKGVQKKTLTILSNDPDERALNVQLFAEGLKGKVGFVERGRQTPIGKKKTRTKGAQWIDYDNDGRLDLYLVGKGGNRLFKNTGNGHFSDVTAATHTGNNGLEAKGATWADVDNDGDIDLFIANADAPPTLLRNNHGKFGSTTSTPGGLSATSGEGASGGIWLDFNNDGRIDLFVVHQNTSNQLFKSVGFFQFTEIASKAGVASKSDGRSAISADFNGDGYPDLYVVNFHHPNRMYLNNKNETFRDITASSLTGFAGGSVQALVSDYDGDGDMDLFVVNSEGPCVLYRNQGNLKFQNVTGASGLTVPHSATSASFSDYDNDGDQDLIVVQKGADNMLFLNGGDGKFTRATDVDINDSSDPSSVSDGDYNNDGTTDTAVGDDSEDADHNDSVYENTGGEANHWLEITLQGTKSNRAAIGAKVLLKVGSLFMAREVTGGNGQNQESLPLEFGLGTATSATAVIVSWPSGATQTFENVAGDRRIKITEP